MNSAMKQLWSESAYIVQRILYEKGEPTLREIIEASGLDRVTVWRKLTLLMRFGLVEGRIALRDGKQVKIFTFTPKGRKAFEHMLAYVQLVLGEHNPCATHVLHEGGAHDLSQKGGEKERHASGQG